MNVVFTCGGTAGHVNPAIAVANIWKERYPDGNILFIGGQDEMEKDLVPQAGYEFFGFDAPCFQRGKNWEALRYNLRAVGRIYRAFRKCRKRIKEMNADIVVGTPASPLCWLPGLWGSPPVSTRAMPCRVLPPAWWPTGWTGC